MKVTRKRKEKKKEKGKKLGYIKRSLIRKKKVAAAVYTP